MTWEDLGNPTPYPSVETYAAPSWPKGKVNVLPAEAYIETAKFSDVVSSRRSRRTFRRLDVLQLSRLLALTCSVHRTLESPFGVPLSLRPAPSAGAIHPIHVILGASEPHTWQRYDPWRHCLVELTSRVVLAEVRTAMDALVPGEEGTLILFAAEPQKTLHKYEHGGSLVWRDAGVLQGYFALAAEALELNFCLLGVTGEPWVSRLVDGLHLTGVGAAYVGSRC